ncbi:MAG: single-stranded-DNA-specific exonuclease RecJ [Fibrella sp.]|nr:single-stranded-DNA-specific exonuclease RecJ [Armatimonadota bacterium]
MSNVPQNLYVPSQHARDTAPTAKWQVATPDPAAVDRLVATLDLSPITAALLVNRGVTTPDAAHSFFSPDLADLSDPYRFPDMEAAVDRLAFAVENKERIFVHGDYDADGVTSAALCVRALQSLGGDVTGYVPRRSDGYDLQKPGVDKAKSREAKLILTADCGVQAVEPVAYAKELGIDVVVTDHHRPGKTLPDACAIVNPYRDDPAAIARTSVLGFQDYVGVAVAFKTLDALTERIRPTARTAFRKNFLDLVALGTVQDMAPVVGENRLFATHGLAALASSQKKGIQTLLTHFGLDKGETLLSEHISFRFGPFLNSAGRMGDADKAYRLLITRDQDEADQIAADLEGMNTQRKQEQARIVADATTLALLPEYTERRVLVLAQDTWKGGLVGLAAGNLVGLFNRPVILLGFNRERNEYHGSARGFGNFHMLDALKACDALGMLGRYGGHSSAAGVTVLGDHLEAFCDKMHDLAEDTVDMTDLAPTLAIDAEIPDGRALTFALLEEIDRLEPWGRGNEEPLFSTANVRVQEVRRVGKDQNTLNLQLQLPGMFGAMKAVWFKNGAAADTLAPGSRIDIAYRPKFNHWQGTTKIELYLKDLRSSDI